MKTAGIIVSAGKGSRFGGSLPKQFYPLIGKPVVAWSLLCFERSELIDEIYLVIDLKYLKKYQKIIDEYGIKKIIKIVKGGRERQYSVFNGINSIEGKCDIVVVHDAVRPFVTDTLLSKIIRTAQRFGSAVPGVKAIDTLKAVNKNFVERTIDRKHIYAIQTPQAFRYEILKSAHIKARESKYTGTDDAELVEMAGGRVRIVEGDYRNVKITTKYDILIGEAIARSLL